MKSFIKKTAVALAFVVGVTSIPMSVSVQAQAEQSAYDKKFQVKVVDYDNNGDHWDGNSVLAKAFDGDVKTHWETRRQNGNFKNYVIAKFEKEELISSISYYPRVSGEANKGFPTKYSIYVTDAENPLKTDVWVPLQTETATVASGELKIKLKRESEVTGVKFVFEEAHKGWAAIGELKFYRPDPLTDKVNDLFTDGTMSALKSNVNKNYLNGLLAEAKEHPSKHLAERVQLALDIIDKKKDVASEVFKVEQRGNGESHARNTLKTSSYGSNLLPIGYASNKGDEVKVYVEVEDGKPLPQVVFTQQYGSWKGWKNAYALKEGANVFKSPRSGAIYLWYPYTEEQGGNPKVRIEGAYKYPLFKDQGNVDDFIAFLKEYKTEREKDPSKRVDIVELVSDYAILNSNLQSANIYLQEENPRTPQQAIDKNKDRIIEYFELAGISVDSEGVHGRNGARANMRLMQPYGLAYAAGDHTGFQQAAMNLIFAGNNYGWAIAHELGHHFDIKGAYIGEVTNNMWSNYNAVVLNGESDRITSGQYDNIFQKAGAYNHAELDRNGTNSLAIWWQLYLLDENYWAEYNASVREGKFSQFNVNNNERMVLASSYAIGYDLTEYFVRHKFISEEIAKKLKPMLVELKVEEMPKHIKPWYMHTKVIKNRNAKFNKEVETPKIESVKVVNDKIQIKISAMDEVNQKALLGYEVLRDGEVIGLSTTNTFTTIENNDNKLHTYKVRALDMSFGATNFSDEFKFQGQQPYIDVAKSTIVSVGKIVDTSVVNYVYTTDANGQAMTPNVSFPNIGNVAGYHTINFSATGKTGDSTIKTIRFHVVSESVYADEMEFVKIENGKEYNVNKQWDLFESFVEVEGEGTARFQVYVDNALKFDSGNMTKNSKTKYVKLEIPKNNKVKLVVSGDAQGTWNGAKFAKIQPRNNDLKMMNNIKIKVADAIKGADVTDVTHVTYNSIVESVEDNVYEKAIYNSLKVALSDVEGIVAVAINNYLGYDTAEEIVNNCVHISYRPEGSDVTYYTVGDRIGKTEN